MRTCESSDFEQSQGDSITCQLYNDWYKLAYDLQVGFSFFLFPLFFLFLFPFTVSSTYSSKRTNPSKIFQGISRNLLFFKLLKSVKEKIWKKKSLIRIKQCVKIMIILLYINETKKKFLLHQKNTYTSFNFRLFEKASRDIHAKPVCEIVLLYFK